jgi:hypothetical protein
MSMSNDKNNMNYHLFLNGGHPTPRLQPTNFTTPFN